MAGWKPVLHETMNVEDKGDSASPETRRAAIQVSVLFLLILVLILFFSSRFVLVELAARRLGYPMLIAAAEAMAILGIGKMARRAAAQMLVEPASVGRLTVDFVVGYPLFGSLVFLVSALKISVPISVILLLAGVAMGALALRDYSWQPLVLQRVTGRSLFAVVLLSSAFSLSLLSAQLPPTTLDELAYHLAVPQTWVLEGRVIDLPLLSHSYFPLGIESLDVLSLSLLGTNGATASHLVHLIAAIATVALLFSWLRQHAGNDWAVVGVVSIVLTPAFLVTAGWSWNDWPLLGICLALIIAFEESRNASRVSPIGVALAAGLLTKYTFAVFAVAVLAAGWTSSEFDRKRLLRALALGLIVGSIFYARNLITAGNPLAPFLGDDAPHVSSYRQATDMQSLLENYVFEGRFLDEALGITLIVLPFAGIITWRFLRQDRFLFLTAISLWIGLVFLTILQPSARILLPFLVALSALGVVSLQRFFGAEAPRWQGAFAWILLFAAAIQLFLAAFYVSTLEPFTVLSGKATPRDYLLRHRAEYSDLEWLNTQLPAASRTLVVGIHELFWIGRPARGGGNFDGPRIDAYLAGAGLDERLRGDGITHVAVFSRGIRVGPPSSDIKRAERETALSNAGAAGLQRLIREGTALASAPGRAVYRIRR